MSSEILEVFKENLKDKISRFFLIGGLSFVLTLVFGMGTVSPNILSPLPDQDKAVAKSTEYEVFGFAPHWKLGSLDNIDFNVLTTLAYFGVPVRADGNLDERNIGYQKLHSDETVTLFQKAHSYGTRVVLTLTQMNNNDIKEFLDDSQAQERAIDQTLKLVKEQEMDGINIDFEYTGNPKGEYKDKFSKFVRDTSGRLHKEIKGSHLSVSVYASSAKDEKLYDIASLSASSDAIFMMAYDFATTGSDTVIPTSPLYGHKEGKYWYDVSTAVEDFLKLMPADKLILGLPWYGYNYPVTSPGVKVERYKGYYYTYYWRWRKYRAFKSVPSNAQTYASAMDDINTESSGWDEHGQVGWKAYKEDGIWRMIFLDDERSLKIKYQFAKDKKLGGVGIWALGFDTGKNEMWSLLDSEFGVKFASKVSSK